MSLASLGSWSLGWNARRRCARTRSLWTPPRARSPTRSFWPARELSASPRSAWLLLCRPGSISPWRSMRVSLLAPLPFLWICASPSWRLAGAEQVIEAVENGGQVREVGSEARSLVHTSGTTGVPRPVVLSLGNILANALGCAAALGVSRGDRWLCPLPLHHIAWAHGAVALRDLWDHGGHRARGPFRHHRRFARSDPARATDRSSASAVAPRGAARRCGRGSFAARPCP